MNGKHNPWMISTFFLVGLIIGFGLGKFAPNNFLDLQAKNVEGQTAIVKNGTLNDIGQIPQVQQTTNTDGQLQPQPPPSEQIEPVDYNSFEKGQTKEGLWTLGSPKAKVTVEEFSDFQCPFCHQYFLQTFHQLLKNYVATGKVYYVYYNYPLNFHPQAEPAAEAALCAGDQKKYWEMHDALFNEQSSWSGQENHAQIFADIAQKIGLNIDLFSSCIRSEKYAKQIQKDLKTGNNRTVTGTPTFFINGSEKIVGAQDYRDFQSAIETALTK